MKLPIIADTVLLLNVDGLPRLDVDPVVEAGAFVHGYTGAPVIHVESVRAGATIHGEEVVGTTLPFAGQGATGQLTSLELVRVGLRRWAVTSVFVTHVLSPARQDHSLGGTVSHIG